jgi:hypothetical protein
VARPASVSGSAWRPTYGWWPDPADYDVNVVLTPYHWAKDESTEFWFALRGWAGGDEPVWEHEVGFVRYGDQVSVRLSDLDVPPPPERHGGLLEIDGVRLDKEPGRDAKFIGMWIDAHGTDGGGYIIPTVPIVGATKKVARDDVQVAPGVLVGDGVDTELLLLNPIDREIDVRLVVASPDGLTDESKPFKVAGRSACHGTLSQRVIRSRRLLEASDGLGSLAIYTSHRLLPFFGFRQGDGPLLALDHTAPIFG